MSFLFKGIILFLFFFPVNVVAKIVDLYPAQSSSSIQQVFTQLDAFDTVRFNAGVFFIEGITISKPCTVIGDSSSILDGSGKFEIFMITGEQVKILGLTLRNSGYSSLNDFAAIKIIDATKITIENNTLTNTYFGIHISNSSYCFIRNNVVRGKSISELLNGNAIHLWKCHHMIIEHNQVSLHRDGIYLEFVSHSSILHNESNHQMRYGLHFMFSNDDNYAYNTFEHNGAGVAVMYSKKVIMKENRFKDNWGPSAYGLLLKDISDSEISNCHFEENTRGIHMEGSSRIVMEHNDFNDNGWGIVIQASCADNVFEHNNFYNNSFDISTNGDVVLNSFSNNYWDEYEGYDLNKDGIGDIPFHPLSLMALMIEQNPSLLILVKSFMMQLFERMEKSIPTLSPDHFVDAQPVMKLIKHDTNRPPQ